MQSLRRGKKKKIRRKSILYRDWEKEEKVGLLFKSKPLGSGTL